ncbi:Syntaxin-like protein psy1 [Tolypocladium ophioglossoides CBS 100239]|uniref:Syntaxin-like protein psy1 n=1 Tax=Tolypocladium ophioglossoides (strain CBS 100239) TaxID=1163406 RepID=A0A0L0NC20_TOLOC|nr:Syntaxin-like protein psy1 [Tolypocladium ophioglossoides CBS 100239]
MAQQYGYGGRPNPYSQQDNAPGYGAPPPRQPQGAYGQGSPYGGGHGYGQNSSIDAGYAGGNVEMAPLAQNASSMAGGDPNSILNECRDIDRGIDDIERNLEQLRMLQKRTLDDADSSSSSAANRQLDSLSSDTMALYRSLTERVRTVKSSPESRTPKNNPQVGRVDRRLKAAIQQYQQVESQLRKRTQEQMARQYRIVRPNATEDEVHAAVEDTTGGQVFSQALMQSDRQGRARAALTAVQDRHAALVKIEQQMVELAQLFQDMDTLVVQQEAAVMQIEQKGEEVVDNLDKGNEEIGVAVNTARKTRKKKWICLGICVTIIIIVVIIVLVYIFVIRQTTGGGNNNKNSSKRDLIEELGALPIVNTLPVTLRRESHLGARMPIDQDVAREMARIGRQRIHLPQIPQ